MAGGHTHRSQNLLGVAFAPRGNLRLLTASRPSAIKRGCLSKGGFVFINHQRSFLPGVFFRLGCQEPSLVDRFAKGLLPDGVGDQVGALTGMPSHSLSLAVYAAKTSCGDSRSEKTISWAKSEHHSRAVARSPEVPPISSWPPSGRRMSCACPKKPSVSLVLSRLRSSAVRLFMERRCTRRLDKGCPGGRISILFLQQRRPDASNDYMSPGPARSFEKFTSKILISNSPQFRAFMALLPGRTASHCYLRPGLFG